MDARDGYSYMDLRKQFSTRRYTYEGHGGQKHDKTLILQMSENYPGDTIILRLCKRLGARVTWSSCFKGKLFFASLLTILAMFCYFNLFSSYLPKPCRVFTPSTSRTLKSVANETVLIRTRNSFSEDIYTLLAPPLSKNSQYVSTFTRKVAMEMRENGVSTTILQQYSKAFMSAPDTVNRQEALTSSPSAEYNNGAVLEENLISKSDIVVEFEVGRIGNKMPLLSRIMETKKTVNLN